MDYFEAVKKRRSIRKFKDSDIPQADIEKIIRAAGDAPSASNKQNWHFVVIRSDQLKKDMAKALQNRIGTISANLPEEQASSFRQYAAFSSFFQHAPVVVAVYAVEFLPANYQILLDAGDEIGAQRLMDGRPSMQSIGAAIENMLLAAAALGYGGCWICSTNHSALVLEELIGYHEEEYKLVSLVPLGVPETESAGPARKPLEEIMTVIDE